MLAEAMPEPPQVRIASRRPIVLKYVTLDARLTPRTTLDGQTIVFTHVPKAAGITLDHIMEAATKAGGLVRRRAMGTIYGQYLGAGKREASRDFDELDAAALARVDYLTGHLPFGVHDRIGRPAFYVTLLREPAARLLSHFRFGVQRGGWLADADVNALIAQRRIADNAQTRQIAGMADASELCTAATFETALLNLRTRYGVVGVAERFDETLRALIALLGWPDIAYTDKQSTTAVIGPAAEARVAAAARRHFAWDERLHAYAAGLARPWAAGLLEPRTGSPPARDRVLLVSPAIRVGGRTMSLLGAADFAALRAGLVERGVEVRDV